MSCVTSAVGTSGTVITGQSVQVTQQESTISLPGSTTTTTYITTICTIRGYATSSSCDTSTGTSVIEVPGKIERTQVPVSVTITAYDTQYTTFYSTLCTASPITTTTTSPTTDPTSTTSATTSTPPTSGPLAITTDDPTSSSATSPSYTTTTTTSTSPATSPLPTTTIATSTSPATSPLPTTTTVTSTSPPTSPLPITTTVTSTSPATSPLPTTTTVTSTSPATSPLPTTITVTSTTSPLPSTTATSTLFPSSQATTTTLVPSSTEPTSPTITTTISTTTSIISPSTIMQTPTSQASPSTTPSPSTVTIITTTTPTETTTTPVTTSSTTPEPTTITTTTTSFSYPSASSQSSPPTKTVTNTVVSVNLATSSTIILPGLSYPDGQGPSNGINPYRIPPGTIVGAVIGGLGGVVLLWVIFYIFFRSAKGGRPFLYYRAPSGDGEVIQNQGSNSLLYHQSFSHMQEWSGDSLYSTPDQTQGQLVNTDTLLSIASQEQGLRHEFQQAQGLATNAQDPQVQVTTGISGMAQQRLAAAIPAPVGLYSHSTSGKHHNILQSSSSLVSSMRGSDAQQSSHGGSASQISDPSVITPFILSPIPGGLPLSAGPTSSSSITPFILSPLRRDHPLPQYTSANQAEPLKPSSRLRQRTEASS